MSDSTAEGVLTLNGNWLDNNATATSTVITSTNCGGGISYTIPNYCNTLWYGGYTARPIKLALSEIERLRTAAKRDAKLKAILAKFTDQIEIVVDFE